MKLYSSEMIDLYLNKKKKGLKISLYPLIIIVPLFVFFIIMVKLKTRVLYTTLSTIDLSIFSVIFIYNLLENIIKSNDLIKHINIVLNGDTLYELHDEVIHPLLFADVVDVYDIGMHQSGCGLRLRFELGYKA